jgi:acyl-CoA thioesterase-1
MMRHTLHLFVRILSLVFLLPSSVALAAEEEEDAPAPYQLVMLGDSLTAGFNLPDDAALPAALERALAARGYSHISVINAGLSGDTTAGGLARFDFSVGPEANGVLLALGANDALQGIDPVRAKANIDAMISKAKARNLDIAMAGMLAPFNMGETYRDAFDGMYPDLAEAHTVPLYPFLLEPIIFDPDLLLSDGMHPNIEGAEALAGPLADFLIENLFDK